MAEPKSRAIIGQDLDCVPASVSEQEHGSTEGILTQHSSTNGGQAVNAAPEIHRFTGHKDAHLGGDLEHLILLEMQAPTPAPHNLQILEAVLSPFAPHPCASLGYAIPYPVFHHGGRHFSHRR